ncbi:ClC family H(+)/Cl(-) exchange transporter [Atopobacter phocae]|uniref:ClC family H(+)/Cl(-) exchange transporter n=1 Tax=Atopobacter phocae TaxID=136492 RepID=UPI0004722839|nr:ClC family H(+)/Cl(-) exchange transporter [Atopobacter phocae]
MYKNKSHHLFDAIHRDKHIRRRLVIEGVLVGIVAGSGAVLYRYLLSYAGEFSHSLYSKHTVSSIAITFTILLLMGWIAGTLLKRAPLSSGSGIPQVTGELLGEMDMSPRPVLLSKFVGGLTSMIAGLSLGREGPSIQIGAVLGKWVAKRLNLDLTEERVLITAGASAGLSAAFNAPIASTLFVLEEVHKNLAPLFLVPALLAGITADYISKNIFGLTPSFAIKINQMLQPKDYIWLLGLGVLAALVGCAFSKTLVFTQSKMKRLTPDPRIRVMLGFLIAGIIGYLAIDLTGSGHELIFHLIEHPVALSTLFLLMIGKLLYTSISYGTSVPGGIFLPVLVIGCLAGSWFYQSLQLFGFGPEQQLNNFVILGMVGVLTAVVRSPLTSIVLVSEMVGDLQHILTISLVAAIAYLVSEALHVPPIYETLYENMRPTTIQHRPSEKLIIKLSVPLVSEIAHLTVQELSLPAGTLIVAIERNEVEVVPSGTTQLKPYDVLTIVTDTEHVKHIREQFIG